MDAEGFRVLFAEHFPDVWRFARRRTSSSADADDVAAETFAVAWRRRADLPGDQARLWLFGAARNVLANHHRSLRRRDRLHLRVVEDASTEPTSLTHDVGESGLWPALANLTEADRDLLIMRAWDELPVTEIAAILNSRPATISARLHKARRRLAKEIDRQGRQDGVLAGQVSSDPSRERRSDSDE